MTTLYQHPDGPQIAYDAQAHTLKVSDGDHTVIVPIGPVGIRDLAAALQSMTAGEVHQ